MPEYIGSIDQLRRIIREEDLDVRGFYALSLFGLAPYSSAKGYITNIGEVEERVIGRAEEVLPEINRLLACSGAEAKVVAHVVLMSALEWTMDQHLVTNPKVPSGFAREALGHLEAVIAAKNFLLSPRASRSHFKTWGALNFTEITGSDEVWQGELIKGLGSLLDEVNPIDSALLVFSVAADLLALTKTAGELAMSDDRRRSPKRHLADRCIALAQLAGRPAISTAPNSDFLTLVSLIFEIASGERHASLGGAVRSAWAAVRTEGGMHRAVRSALGDTNGAEDAASSQIDKQDRMARKTAVLLRTTLEQVPLGWLEREPLFAAYVASLRRITNKTRSEEIEMEAAEELLANNLRPAKL